MDARIRTFAIWRLSREQALHVVDDRVPWIVHLEKVQLWRQTRQVFKIDPHIPWWGTGRTLSQPQIVASPSGRA